jgi:hypothetical protein
MGAQPSAECTSVGAIHSSAARFPPCGRALTKSLQAAQYPSVRIGLRQSGGSPRSERRRNPPLCRKTTKRELRVFPRAIPLLAVASTFFPAMPVGSGRLPKAATRVAIAANRTSWTYTPSSTAVDAHASEGRALRSSASLSRAVHERALQISYVFPARNLIPAERGIPRLPETVYER